MTYFVYNTEPNIRGSGYFNPADFDAVEQYMTHFENSKYLEFIQKNTEKFYERKQCEDELSIARRKMQYWERQPEFCMKRAEEKIKIVKKKWGQHD